MCICKYICIYIYYSYTHTYICLYTRIGCRIGASRWTKASMYMYVWADNNDTYIPKYISIYAYTKTYTYTHTYTHIHTHANNAGSTRNTATKKQKRTTTFSTGTRSLRICTHREYNSPSPRPPPLS